MPIDLEAVKHQLHLIGHEIPDEVIRAYLEELNQAADLTEGAAGATAEPAQHNDGHPAEASYDASAPSRARELHAYDSQDCPDCCDDNERQYVTASAGGSGIDCMGSIQIPSSATELSADAQSHGDKHNSAEETSTFNHTDVDASVSNLKASTRILHECPAADASSETAPRQAGAQPDVPPSPRQGRSDPRSKALTHDILSKDESFRGESSHTALMEDLQRRIDNLLSSRERTGDTSAAEPSAAPLCSPSLALPATTVGDVQLRPPRTADSSAGPPSGRRLSAAERVPAVTARATDILRRHETLRQQILGMDIAQGELTRSRVSEAGPGSRAVELPHRASAAPAAVGSRRRPGTSGGREAEHRQERAQRRTRPQSARALSEHHVGWAEHGARPPTPQPAGARPTSAASAHAHLRRPVNVGRAFMSGRSHPSGTVRKVDRVARYNQLQQQWSKDKFLKHSAKRPIEGYMHMYAAAHAQAKSDREQARDADA